MLMNLSCVIAINVLDAVIVVVVVGVVSFVTQSV